MGLFFMDYNHISEIVRRGLLFLNSVNFDAISASIKNISNIDTIRMEQAAKQMSETNQAAIHQHGRVLSTINWDLLNTITEQNNIAMFKAMDRTQRMSTLAIANSINSINLINRIDIPSLSTNISSILANIDTTSIFERYDSLNELFKEFEIDQKTLYCALNEYQWFILPNMPIDIVFELINVSKTEKSRTNINKVFFNYFTENKYENLKELVDNWNASQNYRPGRLKIINDCLKSITKSDKRKLPSNLIVPTLVAQIDGIQREFLYKNDFEPTYGSKVRFKGEEKSVTQNAAWKRVYLPTDEYSSIINEVILDVLFASVNPGEPIKTPITFSRHKIMHGEHLNYGTSPNMFRTFIILDFLHDLY